MIITSLRRLIGGRVGECGWLCYDRYERNAWWVMNVRNGGDTLCFASRWRNENFLCWGSFFRDINQDEYSLAMSVSLHPCLRADRNYNDYATKSSQVFCQLGDCENVQKILKRGVSPNRVGSFGWTALQEAAEESHSAVVSLLCLQGDLNFRTVKTVSS